MKVLLLYQRRGKEMRDALAKEGVDVELCSSRNILVKLWKVLFTKADVYHANNPYLNGLLVLLGALLHGGKATATIRGKGDLLHAEERYGKRKARRLKCIERYVLKRLDKIFFVSKDTANAYTKVYPFIKKRARVPLNGTEFERFSTGKKKKLNKLYEKISSKTRVIVSSTNFNYEEKATGVKTLIDAMQLVDDEDALLLILGKGTFLSNLKKYAEGKDKVLFGGFRKDLPDIYKSSVFFVYCSYLDGLPTAVLEAQSASLAVIYNDHDGIQESVAPVSRKLVASNPRTYAQKIEKLLSEPEKTRIIGKKAQQYIREHFTWERICERYVEEWKD